MENYRNSYASTKRMPPLKEVAKKLHPEGFGEESETLKDKGKGKEKGKEKLK